MARILVGSQGNSTRSLSASFLAVPGVYARHCGFILRVFLGSFAFVFYEGKWVSLVVYGALMTVPDSSPEHLRVYPLGSRTC
jgi:hypothetical protein